MSSNWTDRIKNSEANPPEKGWDKVAASLDDSLNGYKFPVTLYNIEVDPPSATWGKIQDSLDDDEQAPVIPLRKPNSIPGLLKYAIAASIIGLIAFGAIRYFNITPDKIDVAVAPVVMPSKTDTPALRDNPQPNSTQSNEVQSDTDENALEQSKGTYARLDVHSSSFSSKINKALYRSPAQLADSYSETGFQKNLELQYPHRAAVNDSPSDNSAGRYLMFKNSQGQFIRISKKLTDLFCCVSGEEQDEDCNDQLKKWREKIATSSFTPSPDNFMDILDLVNSLQDNRN